MYKNDLATAADNPLLKNDFIPFFLFKTAVGACHYQNGRGEGGGGGISVGYSQPVAIGFLNFWVPCENMLE